jgi:ribosome-associated heat shock protein Hsp15
MTFDTESVRLDKWLWAARFFKTRSLACEAINGGKVHVNGERVKPSRKVNPGDQMVIRQGTVEKTVIVAGLSDKRGPAKQAALLYTETEESIARRETEAEQRRLLAASMPQQERRPSKKQRRQIHRFKNIHDQ